MSEARSKGVRRLRHRENLKFRICPVDNGTVLETIAEVNLDERGAHRRSRVLRVAFQVPC